MPLFGQEEKDGENTTVVTEEEREEAAEQAAEDVESERSEGHFVGVDPVYANASHPTHAPLDGDDGVFEKAAEVEAERRKRDTAATGVSTDDDAEDGDDGDDDGDEG